MEAATVPQVEKKLVRNNTGGYIGVITLNHKGEEVGDNIEPYGTRWMSDAEIILTARAPRRPEDNSFAEQVFYRVNPDTQAREEFRMRPLTLEEDTGRYVPSERYVPPEVLPQDADRAVEQTPAAVRAPAEAPSSSGSADLVPPPPRAAPEPPSPALRTDRVGAPAAQAPARVDGVQSAEGEEEVTSWIEPPEAPGRILAGNLGGEDGPSPQESAAAAPQASNAPPHRVPPVAGQAQAAPQQPGAVAEEHAARVDPEIGEETGAAKPPDQAPPEGEYAQAEEVGSPDAPTAHEPTEAGG